MKQDFLLQNSYAVNTLLLSGKVLYNDPVGEYVSKVADEILENDEALKKTEAKGREEITAANEERRGDGGTGRRGDKKLMLSADFETTFDNDKNRDTRIFVNISQRF